MLPFPFGRLPFAGGALATLTPAATLDATPRIEIETTPGVWTEYTDYLRSAKTKRGRRRSIDRASAGTMIVSLANEDRRFDPENVGTLIYPGQRIRLTADYDFINYPVWQGTIDRIVQSYDPPRKSTAILQCSDALAVLERTRMISTFEAAMKSIVKRVWYRFGEGDGATLATDRSGNDRHGVYGGTPTLEAPPLMFITDDTAVEFSTGASGDYVLMLPGIFPTAAPYSLNFLLNMPLPVAAFTPILYSTRYPDGLTVYMDNLGRINVQQVVAGVIVAYSRTSVAFSSNTYQISIQFVTGQRIKIYDQAGTDWSDAGSAVGTALAISATDYHVFGYTTGATFDEFFVVDYAFTPAEMASINFGASGWFPDSNTSRIDRVLDSVGWPSADAVFMMDDDSSSLIPGDLAGVSALGHIQEVVDTVEGHIFVQADGKLRILGRAVRDSLAYAASLATFGDVPGELRYVGMDGYTLDTELVTNIVRREGYNTTTTASDAASIARYGPRDNTPVALVRSLFLEPLPLDYDLAKYRLAHFKDAIPMVDDLVISPRGDPGNLWPEVLQREISERITLRRRPQNVGTTIEKEMIIEGVDHEIGPKKWLTTLHIDAINATRFFLFDYTLWDAPDWRFSA